MDKSSVGGVTLALGGIVAGLMIEGGNLRQIIQPTAAIIVLGGTVGAVMLQFPLGTVLGAARQLIHVFTGSAPDGQAALRQIIDFANKARRNGIVSLDQDLPSVQDPFMRQALTLAIDGTNPDEVRKIMQLEIDNQAEMEERIPQVFESAGGFAPTIGILGAVMGLIQVMQHLDKVDEVGRGIAVAFVATIYGVGTANLIFLPSAGKLKIRNHERQNVQQMVLEGVVSILEGMNPRVIEMKLGTFLSEQRAVESETVEA
ncbi:MAG TPA: flagellar motor protein [Acidobacteriaceae bacterium]|nr:flagellar motor protein [Acidobacteriaceae bacterium]